MKENLLKRNALMTMKFVHQFFGNNLSVLDNPEAHSTFSRQWMDAWAQEPDKDLHFNRLFCEDRKQA